ncbi:DNA polymerase III subunit delta [Marichromatium purpuratum 984]|uniref:DNA polymerase III subunit delta n=1 Tax=Marichromatium purpuratum 984 TaxID=765910 RepID=W0DVE9_MARPU|nr:DNA polymerase III subunit delta [Marichromatium purpuratum]AHF02575.1 DNA polymerase III subunit delta [Marichromatium purpuratum 984]
MRLRFNQLQAQLARGLAPVYLLCGEEPFQLDEAARLIRAAARKAGFAEREVLDQDGGFDWNALGAAADALSLFSTRKLIELRLGGARIGKEGGAAVREYCARPCADNLLLILAPGLERKELKARWVGAVEECGAVLQVWPLKGRELEQWVEQRLRGVGFAPADGVAALLAERAEGNLLAASQEIEKLRLLGEPGPLGLDDLLGTLADSARFDLFALTDAALVGDRARVQRIIAVLRAEGSAESLVLWVLARELRMLAEAAEAVARQQSPAKVLAAHRVPRPRMPVVERALRGRSSGQLHGLLRRCAEADLAIKGLAPGDPWQRLAAIADDLARGDAH